MCIAVIRFNHFGVMLLGYYGGNILGTYLTSHNSLITMLNINIYDEGNTEFIQINLDFYHFVLSLHLKLKQFYNIVTKRPNIV